jgi:Zn-dependent M32 family carboxypeptidase
MLAHYIKVANNDIENLVELTKLDIEDIKKADHERLFSRSKTKEELITSFTNKKSLLDNELSKKLKSSPNSKLEEILSQEESEEFAQLKSSLNALYEVNKKFAKFVVGVSEFYNSLVESMFPYETKGYKKTNPKPATFLAMSV